MRLYHYTSLMHWRSIKRDGYIDVTESNVDILRDHAGPDVVWLTNESYDSTPPMLASIVDKTAVRILVEVPDDEVHRADTWMLEHGADPEWIAILERAGGSSATTWYVVERPIHHDEWYDVEFKEDGD